MTSQQPETGQPKKPARCVVCGCELKPHETPEGICDPCLKTDADKWDNPPRWGRQ